MVLCARRCAPTAVSVRPRYWVQPVRVHGLVCVVDAVQLQREEHWRGRRSRDCPAVRSARCPRCTCWLVFLSCIRLFVFAFFVCLFACLRLLTCLLEKKPFQFVRHNWSDSMRSKIKNSYTATITGTLDFLRRLACRPWSLRGSSASQSSPWSPSL
jgi:hypothetical protein